MALLMMEGFEGLHTTEGASVRTEVTDELNRKWSVRWNTAAAQKPFLRAGETSGKALSWSDGNTGDNNAINWRLPRDIAGEEIVVGFRIKLRDHIAGPGVQELLVVLAGLTGSSARQLQLAIDYSDSNKLSVRRQGTVLETEASGTLLANTWHYIEFKFLIAESPTGSYTVRIDDTIVLSGSGIDTSALSGANDIAWALEWQGAEGTGGGVAEEMLLDDIYVLDVTGAVNNDFLGSSTQVVLLTPTSDGTTNNFTPQSGVDNYQMVDEIPAVSTDYNDGAVNGDIDEYGFSTVGSSTILAVSLQTHVTLDSFGGVRTYRHRARSGATIGNGSDIPVVDDTTHEEIFEVDPNTSAAWTASNVDAAEFGVEVRD